MYKDIYFVKTDFGTFQVRITNTDGVIIGKNACVQIKKHDIYKNMGELQWLSTKEPCEEYDKLIMNDTTIKMVYLGITIFTEIHPEITDIYLLDNAKYNCELHTKRITQIHMSKYEFLLYGESYYESRYNARPFLDDEYNNYRQFQKNRENAKYKILSFQFNNDALQLLYNQYDIRTWNDFMNEVITKYGTRQCNLFYSWYLNAVAIISDSKSFPEYWTFPILKRNIISYKKLETKNNKNDKNKKGGKRNYTVKSRDKLYIVGPYVHNGAYNYT
jgi:hypothetical protein